MIRTFKGLAVALGLLFAQPALAATTSYTDSASFTAAIGTSVVDTYENGYSFIQNDATMSGVFGETEYTTTGFANNNIVKDGYYCAGCNGSFTLGFTSTSVGTSNGVFGVGLNFFNNSGLLKDGILYTAFVTFGDGSTANYALPEVLFNLPFTAFFGLTSDKLIASIAFGLPDGGTTRGGGFGIDNLTIGAAPAVAPIPLPAGGLLLLTGIAALGWARRRRA